MFINLTSCVFSATTTGLELEECHIRSGRHISTATMFDLNGAVAVQTAITARLAQINSVDLERE